MGMSRKGVFANAIVDSILEASTKTTAFKVPFQTNLKAPYTV